MRTEKAIKATRLAKATGTRENREKRLVILHIALEGLGITGDSMPESAEIATIIKKMVRGKKSPEKAAAEIASLLGK